MDKEAAQQLRSALRESGLYSASQLAAAEPAFSVSDDARAADLLLSAGVLTQYQYKKLRNGRPLELVFGPFLILDKIGEGGMGKVYKAIHTGSRLIVALKVVRPQLMSNKTVLKRYEREAKAARALDHPNIVGLIDADEVNGRYYIAMEYVDGLDLSRLMRTFGDPPHKGLPQYQEACEYIRQAALGLQHAHERGLVHRDIKPSNLLVYGARALPNTAGKAHVKVLDMGLVRSLLDDEMSRTELTRDGTVVGTPDYMAPEQAKNSSKIDARADVYSLGCALFFLLKGQPPFPDGSPIDKLLRHQLDPPPDIRATRPDIPATLGAIIAKLLRKNPDERYQTAAELAVALGPYCPGATFEELSPDAVPTRQANAEPLVLAASPDAVVDASGPDGLAPTHPTVVPAPAPPPQAGGPTIRVRVLQPGNGKAPAPSRPAAPVPSATAVPRGDAQPSSDSLPGANREPPARGTKPLTKEPTGQLPQPVTGAPVRRAPAPRPRKPTPPPKRGGFPLWIAAVVLVAILVISAVAILVFNRKPKDESSQPTSPSGTASRPTNSTPEPTGPRTLPPIATILPDRTTAAVVIRPDVFWKRVVYEPGSGRRVGAHADAFTERARFDAHKFDRLTIAFTGRDGAAVAIGEGAFLTPEWVTGLESTWKAKLDVANGIKAFRLNASAPPRYAMALGTTGYAVANERKMLEGLLTRIDEKRTPQGISDNVLGAFGDTSSANAPLVTFAAGPTWTLPDETTLSTHGVRGLKGTVTLKDNVFRYEVVLSGSSKSRLSEFWNEYMATKLPEQFPAFRSFANTLATAKQSERVTGAETELHLAGEIEWPAFHDAMDRLLPLPEKEMK